MPDAAAYEAGAARLAVITGLAGPLWLLVMVIAGGAAFPGYSHVSQFISELGARGAPHGELVSWLGFLPVGLLVTAFAFSAWRALPRSGLTTAGLAGIGLFAVGYVAATFFPCDFGCRPKTPSLSQGLHNLFGLAGYLTAPFALFVLALGARKWPGALHLQAAGWAGGVCALAGLQLLSPGFAYVGIAQRVIEASVLGWIVLCALYIRHKAA